MEIKSEILKILDENFDNYITRHKEHKERVLKGFDWFKENVTSIKTDGVIEISSNHVPAKQSNSFMGTKVNVNGVRCMCISNDLRGCPYFNVDFTFRPLSSNDMGDNGAGSAIRITF
jgi:hypothetical protein